MNIFEGARRIAKIFYVLIATIGALLAFGTDPYLNEYYRAEDGVKLVSTSSCGSEQSFRGEVIGQPNWASATVCGYDSGPKTIPLDQAELTKFSEAVYRKRLEHYTSIGTGTVLSLVAAMVFTWCVGWITRGFLGVPRGQDQRAPASGAANAPGNT